MLSSSHLGGSHLGADPTPQTAATTPATVPAPMMPAATSLLTIGIIAVVTYFLISALKGKSTDE